MGTSINPNLAIRTTLMGTVLYTAHLSGVTSENAYPRHNFGTHLAH
jgi:hypothetical protein